MDIIVLSNLPNLETIRGAIGNLGSVYTSFSTVPDAMKPKTAPAAAGADEGAAIDGDGDGVDGVGAKISTGTKQQKKIDDSNIFKAGRSSVEKLTLGKEGLEKVDEKAKEGVFVETFNNILNDIRRNEEAINNLLRRLKDSEFNIHLLDDEIKQIDENFVEIKKYLEDLPEEIREIAQGLIDKAIEDFSFQEAKLVLGIAGLQRQTLEINGFMESVKANRPEKRLIQCGVKPEDIVAGLSIVPGGTITHTFGKKASYVYSIGGGLSPFSIGVSGSDGTNLTAKQIQPFGRPFEIQISGKLGEGEYKVYALDKDSRLAVLKVEVKKTGTKAGTPLELAEKKVALFKIVRELNQDKVAILQKAICMSEHMQDKELGSITTGQLEDFLARKEINTTFNKATAKNFLETLIGEPFPYTKVVCKPWKAEVIIKAAKSISTGKNEKISFSNRTFTIEKVTLNAEQKLEITLSYTKGTKPAFGPEVLKNLKKKMLKKSKNRQVRAMLETSDIEILFVKK